MSQILKMDSSYGSLLIESEGNQVRQRGRDHKNVIKKLDIMLEKVLQEQIVIQCELFTDVFKELKELEKKPKKAKIEFGLKINGEGNIYVVKTTAEANFKINFEWEL